MNLECNVAPVRILKIVLYKVVYPGELQFVSPPLFSINTIYISYMISVTGKYTGFVSPFFVQNILPVIILMAENDIILSTISMMMMLMMMIIIINNNNNINKNNKTTTTTTAAAAVSTAADNANNLKNLGRLDTVYFKVQRYRCVMALVEMLTNG